MKNIYFVGLPNTEKGLDDFDYIAKVVPAVFHWYCYKIEDEKRLHYPHINFHIGLDDAELKKSISKMDIFLSCSHSEGFSLPIAEAIMMKKPVLAYRLKEVESVYKDTIEYIDCFDVEKMKARLINIINEGSIIDLDYASEFITRNFSPKVVSEKLLSLII